MVQVHAHMYMFLFKNFNELFKMFSNHVLYNHKKTQAGDLKNIAVCFKSIF